MSGAAVAAEGRLVRDGGGFALRQDGGARLRLDLQRVPVDHVEKRVRISGTLTADGRVDVEAIAAA